MYVHLFRVCIMVLANATIWLPFIGKGEQKKKINRDVKLKALPLSFISDVSIRRFFSCLFDLIEWTKFFFYCRFFKSDTLFLFLFMRQSQIHTDTCTFFFRHRVVRVSNACFILKFCFCCSHNVLHPVFDDNNDQTEWFPFYGKTMTHTQTDTQQ